MRQWGTSPRLTGQREPIRVTPGMTGEGKAVPFTGGSSRVHRRSRTRSSRRRYSPRSLAFGLFALALVALVLSVQPAFAASFAVNSTADTVDVNPGTGVCADAANNCTLRAAIMETNALPGADTIMLPAGTYLLTLPNAGGVNEDMDATGDLDVTDSLTINGAGSGSTIIEAGTNTSNGIDKVIALNP